MDRTRKMGNSVTDLMEIYDRTSSGHWFDKSTMKFFNTRLPGDFRRLDDKRALFISTEQGPSMPRRASVRIAVITDYEREDGDMVSKVDIDTVGEFNKMTPDKARKFMKEWVG